jgi:hypothetical protein
MSKSLFDVLACQCGMRFRSMSAEAVHRHNFPALCRQPKAPQPKPGCLLVWKREQDDTHYGRPVYAYTATRGDREYHIMWATDAGFGYSAIRRMPNGQSEYLTARHGIYWARRLGICKDLCEKLESENGK